MLKCFWKKEAAKENGTYVYRGFGSISSKGSYFKEIKSETGLIEDVKVNIDGKNFGRGAARPQVSHDLQLYG